MIKTIVIGSQAKSVFYRNQLQNSGLFEYVGYYNPDEINSNFNLAGQYIFNLELMSKAQVFVVDRHLEQIPFDLLMDLARNGKHILIDGFSIHNFHEVESLLKIQEESGSCIHLANVLHNKPLFTTAAQFVRKPRYIKIEKHSNTPLHGEFESWMFKNIGQELDWVLRMTGARVRSVIAKPMFLFGTRPDLINIHLEFENDAICHINVGRAMDPKTHKLRIYQQDRFYTINVADNDITEYRPQNLSEQLSFLEPEQPNHVTEYTEINRSVMPFDLWAMELRNFRENIDKKLSPITGLRHLADATDLNARLVEKVQRRYLEVV